jgi:uncharacterized protein with FMN-binding domain
MYILYISQFYYIFNVPEQSAVHLRAVIYVGGFMKNSLFFVLVLAFLGGCALLGYKGQEGGDVHEGRGMGYRGPITVQVRLNGGSITEIIIVESEEDRFVGGAAMEELADLVILYNSTDLDAVSGATESSKGFLEAVENAIMNK